MKQKIMSGMRPTGKLHLGHYLGVIDNWVKLQDEYDCYFMLADLHTITERQVAKDFRKNAMDLLALFIACGLDPEKSPIFFQSHVPAHAQLGWVLTCNTYMGELSRMTQFKDKSQKHEGNINAGLFTYPSLMAADILLYQADLVPVGHDQLQHVELARDIANRFNHFYGDTLTVPEAYIPKVGKRIMSLQTPEMKMSKSDPNPNGFVRLLDDPDTIMRKFKRAVTDSDNVIKASPEKPGVTNLLSIYSAVTNKTMEESEHEFEGMGYGDFKLAVGEAVVSALKPLQTEFDRLSKDKAYVEGVYKKGAEFANYLSNKTLRKVYKKIGFVAK